ncbi:MAG: polysaccharide deacetylase family protein [Myxococcales bacterium]|jgi:peptidoglycan/xylan/chitin deacetylase (PgdA/CDA1 family)
MARGGLLVSLDFELHWGLRDVVSVREKRDHFLRARDSIPQVLHLFTTYGIHATWATVGFLFARSKRQLVEHLPELRPRYTRRELDPYRFLDEIGDDEQSDPFHYAVSILEAVAETPNQEIASHTFSHYYCLEDGQTQETFEADMQAAAAIGEPFGKVIRTVVFPRGQHNPAYDSVLAKLGVEAYRAPPRFFAYRPRPIDAERLADRGLRLIDTYLPISGSQADSPLPGANGLMPIRAGLFLRPYSPSRRKLEALRMHRIRRAMQEAARKGLDFHMWWHPHNFGSNTQENLAMLDSVLREYRILRDRHGWPSRNMREAVEIARGNP